MNKAPPTLAIIPRVFPLEISPDLGGEGVGFIGSDLSTSDNEFLELDNRFISNIPYLSILLNLILTGCLCLNSVRRVATFAKFIESHNAE